MDEERPFHAFERRGWQRVVSVYDKSFADLTSKTSGPLLDATGVRSGTRVLDIASGPGYIAGEAANRGARVVGLDFSDAMLALTPKNLEAIRNAVRLEASKYDRGGTLALPMPAVLLSGTKP